MAILIGLYMAAIAPISVPHCDSIEMCTWVLMNNFSHVIFAISLRQSVINSTQVSQHGTSARCNRELWHKQIGLVWTFKYIVDSIACTCVAVAVLRVASPRVNGRNNILHHTTRMPAGTAPPRSSLAMELN